MREWLYSEPHGHILPRLAMLQRTQLVLTAGTAVAGVYPGVPGGSHTRGVPGPVYMRVWASISEAMAHIMEPRINNISLTAF